jgi:hypothetical protein
MNRTGKTIGAAFFSAFLGLLVGTAFYVVIESRGRYAPWDRRLMAASVMRSGIGFAVLSFAFLVQKIYSKPEK